MNKQQHRCRRLLQYWSMTCAATATVHAASWRKRETTNGPTRLLTPPQQQQQEVPPPLADVSLSALDIMRIKCGWTPPTTSTDGWDDTDEVDAMACWVYTGRLQDPLTGQVICAVEGVELVQGLASYVSSVSSKEGATMTVNTEQQQLQRSRFQRRCSTLQVSENLLHTLSKNDDSRSRSSTGSNVTNETECGTMMSRKLFCYTEPTASNVDTDTGTLVSTTHPVGVPLPTSRLLESFRKRHGGPKTRIPLDQAVAVFDTAVTCLSSSAPLNHGGESIMTTSPSSSLTPQRLLLHTERPGGTFAWSSAQFPTRDLAARRDGSDSVYEFSVYTRSSSQPNVFSLDDWLGNAAASDDSTKSTTAPRPRRRVALIQLGGGGGVSPRDSGAAAREVYSYRMDKDDADVCQLRYTRYGEAPVWYGPGRLCQLELTGQRLLLPLSSETDWTDVIAPYVPAASLAIRQHKPQFWTFGIARRPRPLLSRPTGKQKQQRQRDVVDDPVFIYYAAALHSALEGTTITNAPRLLSGVEYRRYYRDLAIGRNTIRFRDAPTVSDFDDVHAPPRFAWDGGDSTIHRGRTCRSKLNSCWNKLRAATTISVAESD